MTKGLGLCSLGTCYCREWIFQACWSAAPSPSCRNTLGKALLVDTILSVQLIWGELTWQLFICSECFLPLFPICQIIILPWSRRETDHSVAAGWMCCLSACPTDTFEELLEAFCALKDHVSLRLLDYTLLSCGCKHPVSWHCLSIALEGFLLIDGVFLPLWNTASSFHITLYLLLGFWLITLFL